MRLNNTSKPFPFTARQLVVPKLMTSGPSEKDLQLLEKASKFLKELGGNRPQQSTIWEEQINLSALAQLEKALLESDYIQENQLLQNFWLIDNGRLGATYVNFKKNYLKKRAYCRSVKDLRTSINAFLTGIYCQELGPALPGMV